MSPSVKSVNIVETLTLSLGKVFKSIPIQAIISDAIGPDRVTIQMTSKIILPILCNTFYHFFIDYFSWLITSHIVSRIIPVPKVSKLSSPINYTPISILQFLAKILKRIVHQQLAQYLYKNCIRKCVIQIAIFIIQVSFIKIDLTKHIPIQIVLTIELTLIYLWYSIKSNTYNVFCSVRKVKYSFIK